MEVASDHATRATTKQHAPRHKERGGRKAGAKSGGRKVRLLVRDNLKSLCIFAYCILYATTMYGALNINNHKLQCLIG